MCNVEARRGYLVKYEAVYFRNIQVAGIRTYPVLFPDPEI